MKKQLFWRLFVVIALGGVVFFSLLHSVAILSNEKMSYLKQAHRDEINNWGDKAQRYINQDDWQGLDHFLQRLQTQEQTWISLVHSDLHSVSGSELSNRFWQGFNIGRSVDWKIHLDFPDNPIMEVTLNPTQYHLLIQLPERMRPGTYQSHAFWLFRLVIPFCALLALTIYLYQYVMRPLERFHHVTKAFSRGQFDIRMADKSPLGKDEISQIARTFDHMAQRTEQLITHNRHLIAEMSHEVRTPLTRIEMALDCIEHGIESRAMHDKIRFETQQMRQLAEDTLTLAWLDNEQPKLQHEVVDLPELLQMIIDDATFEYPNRPICYTVQGTAILPNANQRALSQALENIIRNGLRYTPEQQPFSVHMVDDEHFVTITIQDSGPGLDPYHCQAIFKPFFKTDNQPTSRKGFGVGLALARRHIEAVGGQVSASSAKNQGLTMTIQLAKHHTNA